MKKLKKLITRLAKDGDYASLGKIASIIEFVTETSLMRSFAIRDLAWLCRKASSSGTSHWMT